MRASAAISVEGERIGLRSEPPLTLRSTPGAVYVVGSAAGPVGGDELTISVTLGPDSALEVRSAAAAMHHPSPRPSTSTLDARVRLGPDSHLRWLPEPGILIDGCDHRASTRFELAAGATLVWREEWVLGRRGETSGSVLSQVRIERTGRPLLRSDQALGPLWPGADGPAGVDGARAVGSLVVVGHELLNGEPPSSGAGARSRDECRWAALPMAADAIVISAVADRAGLVTKLFDRLVAGLASVSPPLADHDLTFPAAQPV